MPAATSREIVKAKDLRLPPCPIPRPGDSVFWYEGGVPQHGMLRGSTHTGTAVIQRDSGLTTDQISFASIRVTDSQEPTKPMWHSLPDGTIYQPTGEECRELLKLAEHRVLPGPSHYELACEIWRRGFEVFFTGKPLREALMSQGGRDAELITTMPVNWLRTLLGGMYGEEELVSVSHGGRIRVGRVVGSADPYIYTSLFRLDYNDKEYVYGASFESEIGFNDFTFNALYFDPVNKVLIDPTGNGLDDARDRCLRPLSWAATMPAKDRIAIGLEVMRQHLLGATLCPGHEKDLLKFVKDLEDIRTDALAAELSAKVLRGTGLTADDAAIAIDAFLQSNGMESVWIEKIQPAVLLMKASYDDG